MVIFIILIIIIIITIIIFIIFIVININIFMIVIRKALVTPIFHLFSYQDVTGQFVIG